MAIEMRKRFEVIHNIPSPYRIHLFNFLDRELRTRGVDFHVHFMARGHKERPSSWKDPEISFSHTYWKDFGWGTHHLNPGFLLHLLCNKPVDYLMVGSAWDTLTGICASFGSRRNIGIIWTEGNTKTPGKLEGFLGWFKREIIAQYGYVATPGQEGVGYLALHQQRTHQKLPRAIILPNLIDERQFRVRSMWPHEAIMATRAKYGLAVSDRLALCPARLEPVKGLTNFLDNVPIDALKGWKILVIGEGTEKAVLDGIIERRGLKDTVHIENYVQYEKMPSLYVAADLFVLPSVYDPNPLSVIEALHSGLPLLLSKQAGNFPEALLEGKTGWGFSPFDVVEMQSAMRQAFSASTEQLREYGKNAKVQAEKVWNTEYSICKFVDSLNIPRYSDGPLSEALG